MKPQRIQRKRTKGWKMPENTVYVGRPTKWGNPYKVGEFNKDGYGKYPVTREQAVGFYKQFSETWVTFRRVVQINLKGKNLACWCPLNQPCHADVLLKIANEV